MVAQHFSVDKMHVAAGYIISTPAFSPHPHHLLIHTHGRLQQHKGHPSPISLSLDPPAPWPLEGWGRRAFVVLAGQWGIQNGVGWWEERGAGRGQALLQGGLLISSLRLWSATDPLPSQLYLGDS